MGVAAPLLSQGASPCAICQPSDRGKLNDYLADLNEQAEAMLVKLLAEKKGVTEVLKAESQMLWAQKMNNLRNAAIEIVTNELIYR